MKNKRIEIKDFNLSATMECGQCFNFSSLGENEYIITAFRHVVHLKQEKKALVFINDIKDKAGMSIADDEAFSEEIEKIWLPYFDLERDYAAIRKAIVKKDARMKEVVACNSGIRLLNQDFYEMVISFIISQRQNIPAIKRIIRNLSEKYGDYLGSFAGEDYYAFPGVNALCKLSEKDFADCKTGYRASYLVAASNWLKSLDKNLAGLSYEEAKAELLKVKGIGEKVADCILLFGLKKTEAFPVDVWIGRVMNDIYGDEMRKFFEKDSKNKNYSVNYSKKSDENDKKSITNDKVRIFGEAKFGVLSGYAQQFLFDYARNGEKE